MAKKVKKSKAPAPSSKQAKKPVKAKAPAKKSKPAGKRPRSISTGKGANVAEIGSKFVAMFNAPTPDAKIWDALFAKNWTSIEGFGVAMAFDGRKAVVAKCNEWAATHADAGCGQHELRKQADHIEAHAPTTFQNS